jgi:hypothetical protein
MRIQTKVRWMIWYQVHSNTINPSPYHCNRKRPIYSYSSFKHGTFNFFDETIYLTMYAALVRSVVIFIITVFADRVDSLVPDVSIGNFQKDHYHQGLQPLAINGFSPSPKCWKNAISVFHSEQTIQEAKDINSLCASLPDSHQKLLALEIASCHLVDLGKELYRDEGFRDVCMKALHEEYDRKLTVCLKQLTETGENAYTVYITYVQNMCIRLTQELVLLNLQESRQVALEHYREASAESINNMNAIKDLTQLYKNQVEQLTNIPSKISQKLSSDLTDIVQDVVQVAMEKEVSRGLNMYVKDVVDQSMQSLTNKQANDHSNIIEALIKRVEDRDEVNQERFEEWSEYLLSLWQSQAVLMHQHHDTIIEHHRKMETLNDAVNTTTDSMKYLKTIKQLALMFIVGYKWTSSVFYLASNILMIGVLTKTLACSGSWMYFIAIIEFVLELLISANYHYNSTSKWTNRLCIPTLRKWAILIELYILTRDLLAMLASQRPKTRLPRNKVNMKYNEARPFRRHSCLTIPRKPSNKIRQTQFTPTTGTSTSANNREHLNLHPRVAHFDRVDPSHYSKLNESQIHKELFRKRIDANGFRIALPNTIDTTPMETADAGRSSSSFTSFRNTSALVDVDSSSVDDCTTSATNCNSVLESINNETNTRLFQTQNHYSNMNIDTAPTPDVPTGEGLKTKRIALDPPDTVSSTKRRK